MSIFILFHSWTKFLQIRSFIHIWWFRCSSFCLILWSFTKIEILQLSSHRPSDPHSHALNRRKEFWKCVTCVHNLMKTKFLFHSELFTSRRGLSVTVADLQQRACGNSTFGGIRTFYDERKVEQSLDISTWKGNTLTIFYWNMHKVIFNCISKPLCVRFIFHLKQWKQITGAVAFWKWHLGYIQYYEEARTVANYMVF